MNIKNIVLGLLVASSVVVAGCQEGPAEKQGKKIDNAVENAKDTIQNKGPAQKMGENVDEATGNNP